MCLRSCEEEAIFSWVRVRVGFRQVEIFKKGILCDGNTVSKDLEPGKCKERGAWQATVHGVTKREHN